MTCLPVQYYYYTLRYNKHFKIFVNIVIIIIYRVENNHEKMVKFSIF